MYSAEYWIDHLQLRPHPEGGFYRETYRSKENIQVCGLPLRFSSPRSFSTAIHFLLRSEDRSLFHRIKSDEIWHFHAGTTLEIYVLHEDGVTTFRLGDQLEERDMIQVVVPANCWFAAKVISLNSYNLSSCTVAPGFDFLDFELADRRTLLQHYPHHAEIIETFTPSLT